MVELPEFSIDEAVDDDGAVRLTPRGELDIAVADSLEDRLRELSRAGNAVRLELSGLSFIDSSGIRVLVGSVRSARAAGTSLEICREASRAVRRALELSCVDAVVWPTQAASAAADSDA